ncbi:tyrosine-type recombinase/integrase [Tissierella carlieri]|nr:tyrosine-type recombinase/integrase [Tissierella carlieri]
MAERTVQRLLENAKIKLGIKKYVLIYTLVHSFPTHLLEGYIDLRYMQESLGYSISKTIEIHTNVA